MPDRARIVSQLVFSGRAAEVFSGGILHRDLFLSNLGVLPFPSRVGNLEVMRWSGVALPTSKGEQWFSATTVNETLAVTYVSANPREFLLERTVHHMNDAVKVML